MVCIDAAQPVLHAVTHGQRQRPVAVVGPQGRGRPPDGVAQVVGDRRLQRGRAHPGAGVLNQVGPGGAARTLSTGEVAPATGGPGDVEDVRQRVAGEPARDERGSGGAVGVHGGPAQEAAAARRSSRKVRWKPVGCVVSVTCTAPPGAIS